MPPLGGLDVLTQLPSALNMVAVRAYGEAEFWLSGGKFILCIMLFCFTLVTMCGGNPQHDAYGFRHVSLIISSPLTGIF